MSDMPVITEPKKCSDMAEVRAGVDAIDREIIGLLAVRFGYMDAAARIKVDRNAVRDEARKAQVIENVRTAARSAGVSDELVAQLWDQLVEASIAHEYRAWDALNRVN